MEQLATSRLAGSTKRVKLSKPVSVAAMAGVSILLWAAILVPFLA